MSIPMTFTQTMEWTYFTEIQVF